MPLAKLSAVRRTSPSISTRLAIPAVFVQAASTTSRAGGFRKRADGVHRLIPDTWRFPVKRLDRRGERDAGGSSTTGSDGCSVSQGFRL